MQSHPSYILQWAYPQQSLPNVTPEGLLFPEGDMPPDGTRWINVTILSAVSPEHHKSALMNTTSYHA